MKISDVNQYHLEFELEGGFKPTWVPGYTQRIHEAELFEVRTDEGITGITASPSFAGGFDYIDPVKLFLLGEDPHNVEKILRKLESVNLLAPRPWHLEAALWDIIGKDEGKPVYELLGGKYREFKAYASTGELQDADERLGYVEDRVEEGFEAVKLRFQSKDVEKDLNVARRIREEFPDLKLMVDANMGWSVRILGEETRWSQNEAIKVAKELEKIGGIEWLEEPLERRDYHGYARLREKTDVPIAGGEFNNGFYHFREFLKHGSLDVLQPDAVLSTGMLNAKKIADMAKAQGVEFAPHTWTNGVGFLVNLQVMACTHARWCEYPLEPPAWVPESRDFMLKEPIKAEDGIVVPPTKPGLGIEIDWDEVQESGQG